MSTLQSDSATFQLTDYACVEFKVNKKAFQPKIGHFKKKTSFPYACPR